MAKSVFKSLKIKRILFSPIEKPHIFLFLALLLSCMVFLYTITQNQQTVSTSTIMFIAIIVLLGITLMILQSYSGYVKRTYDSRLALQYQRQFEAQDFLKRRVDAAKCIIKNKDNLNKLDKYKDELCVIDWVLDLLEDIGFYTHGGRISPEVAHHHFYHWIRGYWQWTSSYIKAYQSQRNEKSTWEYIEELYLTTSEIETNKGGIMALSPKELDEFIQVEKELLDEYEPT